MGIRFTTFRKLDAVYPRFQKSNIYITVNLLFELATSRKTPELQSRSLIYT